MKKTLIWIFVLCTYDMVYSQVNYIKSTITTVENGKKYLIHRVEKQQSLYAIAKLYEADINEVLKENPLAKNGIKVDQTLKIPIKSNGVSKPEDVKTTSDNTSKKKVSPDAEILAKKESNEKKELNSKPTSQKAIDTSKYFIHTVEAGETLFRIKKLYGIKEKDILDANPEASSGIRTGDELYILKTSENIKIAKEKATKSLEILDAYKNVISKKDSLEKDSFNTIAIRDKKSVYKVAFMLPFNLNALPSAFNLAKEDKAYPVVQDIAIDFYEGAKKAIDSLNKQSLKPEITYFDIDDRDSTKIERLLKTESFSDFDLIIGPLYSSAFNRMAEYARKNKIFIISPLAQQNKILFENPYAIKINPSNNTLVEALAEYLFYEKKEQDIILISTGNSKDLNMIKSFRQRYLELKRMKDPNFSDSIPVVKTIDGVRSNYKSKSTALILFTNNQNFLTSYLMGLSSAYGSNENITLYGLKSLTSFENIDPEYLNRLRFTYPTAFFADEDNDEKVKFQYNNYFEKHNTSPSEYYYEGFDVTYTLLKALIESGPSAFTNLESLKAKGMATKFNFYRPNKKIGYENKSINIIQYSDFQFKKIY